VIARS